MRTQTSSVKVKRHDNRENLKRRLKCLEWKQKQIDKYINIHIPIRLKVLFG